ncbi:MAG TPA: hypothetical protein DIW54_12155 [Chitinophagaceae bacterium]|nr:hypothetical protein [Chitinophagaceae bacterium]
MDIQLINGDFSDKDAIALLEKMIQVKIAFHEDKIGATDAEEDVKHREATIKRLQDSLASLRQYLSAKERISIQALVQLNG